LIPSEPNPTRNDSIPTSLTDELCRLAWVVYRCRVMAAVFMVIGVAATVVARHVSRTFDPEIFSLLAVGLMWVVCRTMAISETIADINNKIDVTNSNTNHPDDTNNEGCANE
jgi:hypothetical protein